MNSFRCTVCLLVCFYPMLASVAEPEKIAVPTQPIDYAVVEDAPAHAASSLSPDDYRLEFEHAHELQQRGGLGHVIGKLEAGENVTVAFLGGSITLAGNGWRPRFMQWMRNEFRSAKITEVNAAVNGTGADFGAARLSRDALQRPPDLLFVEFVVNGGSAGVEQGMVRALEGIVRQTWKANPRADIVFVYTLSEAHLQGYMKDGPPKIPPTAQAHEDVANHYGIPSITLGCQIGDLVRQGILLFRSDVAVPGKIVFSRDGVHPLHDGAQLYAGALVRSLRKLRASPQTAIVRSPLPKPLRQDHWEGAKLYPPTRAKISGSWDLHKMDPQSPHYAPTFTEAKQNVSIIKSLFPELLGTRTPGSSLTIKFRGTMLGLADVGGPFSGQLLVSIDGEPPFVVSRFGGHNRNSRQQYFFLPELPDGLHEVKITLDERSPDKSVVPESAQRPEQYQPNEFYLGSIMVVGEVLPPYDPEVLPKEHEYYELRNGLSNSRSKFEREKTGRVAFLGGSITQSSGWRELVMDFLRQKFPETQFDFIGAGIGSMGSVPHAFRLTRDVLSHGPVDLLFVEAAVNDALNIPQAPQFMLRGMEGIVRQARELNPFTDIVHMHFAMPDHTADYNEGRLPLAIATHEKVAEAYGNPSLNLAKEVAERIQAGDFTWKEDFVGLHPSPFGHALYAHSIKRMLVAAWGGSSANPKPHTLPKVPLDTASYFRGRFGKIEDAKRIKGFQLVPQWVPEVPAETRRGFFNVPALAATKPGSEFEFEFDGTAVGLLIGSGPNAGILEVSCDGGPFERVDTFTMWSKGLYLPWAVLLADNLPPGRHVVRVRISEERNPESAGTALYVFQMLVN